MGKCWGLLFCSIFLALSACRGYYPAPAPTPVYQAIAGVYLGAFQGTTELEEQIGRRFAIQLNYHAWGTGFKSAPYEINAQKGQVILDTWEFKQSLNGPTDPYALQALKAVVDGKHDEYIHKFAQDAKAFGMPVLLRWGHEMNGDWYPWSGKRNGAGTLELFGDPQKPDGPELFVAAYRHIYEIFQQETASNVAFVWCPNIVMPGGALGEPWNDLANYYPGDDAVDWLCMDGYNWGTTQPYSSWLTFDETFRTTYIQLQAINSDKPIMIGETASTEQGGDKAAWISDGLTQLQQAYPQVRAIVWFNINKETDWRINSSPASLEAFRKTLAGPGWLEAPWPGMSP